MPLGAALIAAGVCFLLGILAVLAAEAAICACLVSARVILWGFAKSEFRQQFVRRPEEPVVGQAVDNGAQTLHPKGSQPAARGRDVPRLRRGGGTMA